MGSVTGAILSWNIKKSNNTIIDFKCVKCNEIHKKIYYSRKEYCDKCENEILREYHKIYSSNYYNKNKDKIYQKHKEWMENNKDVYLKYKKNQREKNKEQIKDYRENHRKDIKEYMKNYRKSEKGKKIINKWFEENKEKRKDYIKNYNIKWCKKNKDKVKYYKITRRARRNKVIHYFSKKDWLSKVKGTNGICPKCNINVGKDKLTLDHIYPISKAEEGRLYSINDVQPLCQICNSTKNDRIQ